MGGVGNAAQCKRWRQGVREGPRRGCVHSCAMGVEADYKRYDAYGDILGDLFRAQPATVYVPSPAGAMRDSSPIPRGITNPVSSFTSQIAPSPTPRPVSAAGDMAFGAPRSAYAAPYMKEENLTSADLQESAVHLASYTSQVPHAHFPVGKDGPIVKISPSSLSSSTSRPPHSPLEEPTTNEAKQMQDVMVVDAQAHFSDHAVLRGYNPNTWDPPLHYGDTISLLIDGLNAVTAYAGSEDGVAWIEILQVLLGFSTLLFLFMLVFLLCACIVCVSRCVCMFVSVCMSHTE